MVMVSQLLQVAIVAATMIVIIDHGVMAHNEPHHLDRIQPQHITMKMDPTIAISVTPEVLQQSGDWITLSFSGVSDPKKVSAPFPLHSASHHMYHMQCNNRMIGIHLLRTPPPFPTLSSSTRVNMYVLQTLFIGSRCILRLQWM
jgi:hypothetical protein